jgi:hypothetical protein
MCSTASSVIRVVCAKYMTEFVVWPDTLNTRVNDRVEDIRLP